MYIYRHIYIYIYIFVYLFMYVFIYLHGIVNEGINHIDKQLHIYYTSIHIHIYVHMHSEMVCRFTYKRVRVVIQGRACRSARAISAKAATST